jgi:hypothetical protein
MPSMQYLYWEKVTPTKIDSAPIPYNSLRPLMLNWTEPVAAQRDFYDGKDGRGKGKVSATY